MGNTEEHCDYCGRIYDERPRFEGRSIVDWVYVPHKCNELNCALEYQCVNCRYRCHHMEQAKRHELEQGHHMKLVDLYWHKEE